MELIVEDGSVVSQANSYISYVDAIDYLTVFAADTAMWSNMTEDQFTPFLIKAAKALDDLYGMDYRGTILTQEQPMLFPRSDFYTAQGRYVRSDSVPVNLKNAQCEFAALLYNGGDMVPEFNKSRLVKQESVSVAGAVSESVTYSAVTESEQEKYKGMLVVENLLKPILNTNSSGTEPVNLSL